jgi:hypothetical protein
MPASRRAALEKRLTAQVCAYVNVLL